MSKRTNSVRYTEGLVSQQWGRIIFFGVPQPRVIPTSTTRLLAVMSAEVNLHKHFMTLSKKAEEVGGITWTMTRGLHHEAGMPGPIEAVIVDVISTGGSEHHTPEEIFYELNAFVYDTIRHEKIAYARLDTKYATVRFDNSLDL